MLNHCRKERLLLPLACFLSAFQFVCVKTPIKGLIHVVCQEESFFRIEHLFAGKLFDLPDGASLPTQQHSQAHGSAVSPAMSGNCMPLRHVAI